MEQRFAGNQINMNSDHGSDFDFNDEESHLSSLLDNVVRPQFSKDNDA